MEANTDNDWITSANEAIHLKLVTNPNEVLDDSLSFNPEFTHQLFGDNETVFGYKDLKIMLFYGSGSLATYFGVRYSKIVDPSTSDGVEADNVQQIVTEILPRGFFTNRDEFMRVLVKEESNFRPFGEIMLTYCLDNETFEIRKAEIETPGFKSYHERLRTFLIWYIESASFIDLDDDKWTFYLVFQRKKRTDRLQYNVIGFMSVYNYYGYPDKIRPRISQIIILPPYQRKGHGMKLLESYFSLVESDKKILDVTAEDPSEGFIGLRDFVNCRRCSKLPAFSSSHLNNGFSDDMIEQARVKLKIHKKQARRVYEILRLKATNRGNVKEYQAYKDDIKNRLSIPFKREKKDLLKLQKCLTAEEYAAALSQANSQDKVQLLNESYKALEDTYLSIVEKLAIS